MSAIEFYYGEWEITEDFGYNGIHRTIEKDIYKVGETVLFSRECFKNESSIKITYPRITFEPITPASMVGVYKMTNPEKMGFIWDEQYIRAMVWDDNNGTPIAHTFYILNDDVIIFEGDIHRYYKAIRK
ncbi:MAG: hypothetical protein LBM65_00070 [Oscillospiraceae bacterium]|nr:hypothetical protein [Oscillospiraceae bacterium]